MAARCARGAGRQAADHRVPGLGLGLVLEPMGRSICTAAARTRLDRRRTVVIEFRWADGHSERFAEIASEFVRLKVDVIVTSGAAAPAAKQATSVIPIVFAVAIDPLGTGLIESLARPGGNVTGLSLQQPDTTGKRLELLREIVPGLRRLAILANRGYPAAVVELGEVQKTAHMFGFEVLEPEIRRTEDIALAFDALRGRADAVYVCSEPLVNANRVPHQHVGACRSPADHARKPGIRRN